MAKERINEGMSYFFNLCNISISKYNILHNFLKIILSANLRIYYFTIGKHDLSFMATLTVAGKRRQLQVSTNKFNLPVDRYFVI